MKKLARKIPLAVPPGMAIWVATELEKQRQMGLDSVFTPVAVCIDGPGLDEDMYEDPYGRLACGDKPHEECNTESALRKKFRLRLV